MKHPTGKERRMKDKIIKDVLEDKKSVELPQSDYESIQGDDGVVRISPKKDIPDDFNEIEDPENPGEKVLVPKDPFRYPTDKEILALYVESLPKLPEGEKIVDMYAHYPHKYTFHTKENIRELNAANTTGSISVIKLIGRKNTIFGIVSK